MPSEPEDSDQEPRVKLNLSGRHIRRLRRKKGWSLSRVQDALKHEYHIALDRTSLGRIERGEQTITDLEFGALRDLLAASESELLWGKASTTSEERKRAMRSVQHRYRKPSSGKKQVKDTAKKPKNSENTTSASSEE